MKQREENKVAFFDFCGTLVNFQTADSFIDFARATKRSFYMNTVECMLSILHKTLIIPLIEKLFPGYQISKSLKLMQLRGVKRQEMNILAVAFYRERIKPNLVKPLMEELRSLLQENYDICLVSGGYSVYLEHFAAEHNIKYVISNEIDYTKNSDRCLGKIKGRDCIRGEKVRRVKESFSDKNIDYNNCIAYSDSISDLPLLQMVGEGILVSHGISQLNVYQYKLKELIWD